MTLLVILFHWYFPNWSWSYRDIEQEILSPDGNTFLTIKLDLEDTPYYVFELNRKTFLGRAKLLGECAIPQDGTNLTFNALRWQDDEHFLLQIKQSDKSFKTISIDTEHPAFPCLKPFEDLY